MKAEHEKRRIFSCSVCKEPFRFRYLLMNHISNVHNRTVVDNENGFYKCFVCMRGFRAQHRNNFMQHLSEHKKSTTFCSDCNVSLESIHHLEAHRERSHQDFSLLVDKKLPRQPVKNLPSVAKVAPKPTTKQAPLGSRQRYGEAIQTPMKAESIQQVEDENQFDVIDDGAEQQEQIMVQTEDGSLLNMNNFILTENGELILQNLECLMPNNGQETADDSSGGQVHISNLEQFLMEQGLSSSTEISYIQQDDNQVIIQHDDGTVSQSSQESLMQTYKEIFEPDDDIQTEFIATSEIPDESAAQNLLLNGDFLVQSIPGLEQSSNGQVVEHVEVHNTQAVDANQSTLDELGDILLEVAAAAEKEKKPKATQARTIRETLWGAKKTAVEKRPGVPRKRNNEAFAEKPDQPASNFSQAYEFFVKGFDAKKQKQM